MITTDARFTFLDYFFFAIVFVVSVSVGLYYAIRIRKHHSIEEYLFGGKNLKVLPVSFSLAATAISGSATIGNSMEVYAYGLHNWIFVPLSFTWTILMHYIFLPIFYDLQLNSTFTYFEMRFDRSVKLVASALYVLSGIFVIPLMIYVPALAFQEVTGINLYLIALLSGLLCIWYTAIGGIRVVVWTDVFQFLLILSSSLVILAVGLTSIGIKDVWQALYRGGRLTFFKTEFNLEGRGIIWAYITSVFFVLIYQFGMSQHSIQRYLSLSSLREAKTALWIFVILSMVIVVMQLNIGAVIYATYEDCDPVSAGVFRKFDQIFPHFVQEKASLFAGFNGIFIAGVFAAGLSTTSTFINTISGTIYSDFIGEWLKNASQETFNRIMKGIVVVVGMLGISLVFLIEKLGTIFAITNQCYTLSTVGILGLFINGMLLPKVNSKGAKCGVIISMAVVGVLIIGGLQKTPDPVLPLRTDGCDFGNNTLMHIGNAFTTNSTNLNPNEISWIFRINFQYFCIIGLFFNIFIAYVVSIITGGNTVEDQRLLVPFMRKISQGSLYVFTER